MGLSSWPTLNNSGDQLQITDATGTLIDQVDYTDGWYQDASKSSGGWTLERINPEAPCSDINNWAASVNASGGTPGTQNSVYSNLPDNTLPKVSAFTILGTNQIELLFSKSLDTAAVSTANFSLNLATTVTNTTATDLQTILLSVSPNISDAFIYQLDITGVNDCYSNTIADTSIQIAIGRTPNAFDLIFTEIMATPNASNIGLPEAEYVEIYNPTGDAISLAGVTFSDRSTTGNLPSQIIFPGEYIILTESNSAGSLLLLAEWYRLHRGPR